MKPLVIYHGNCVDGFTAAWAIWKRFGDAFDYYPGSHQAPPPEFGARDLLLVDFSYNREVLQAIARTARSILVLDHHKSAAEDLPEDPGKADTTAVRRLDGECWQTPWSWTQHLAQVAADQQAGARFAAIYAYFDMARSGAGIAWDFFHPETPRPALVNHVEDRDLWRFALPSTREIQAAVFSYEYSFAVWDQLVSMDLATLIRDGTAIERKQQKDVAELVKLCQRFMTIAGQRVPVASLPSTLASDAGNLMAQGQPFSACYWDTPDLRIFGLRSNDQGMDVSAIAKQYGGGGHRNAAGFSVPRDHELARA